jgi:hypothetical protein
MPKNPAVPAAPKRRGRPPKPSATKPLPKAAKASRTVPGLAKALNDMEAAEHYHATANPPLQPAPPLILTAAGQRRIAELSETPSTPTPDMAIAGDPSPADGVLAAGDTDQPDTPPLCAPDALTDEPTEAFDNPPPIERRYLSVAEQRALARALRHSAALIDPPPPPAPDPRPRRLSALPPRHVSQRRVEPPNKKPPESWD